MMRIDFRGGRAGAEDQLVGYCSHEAKGDGGTNWGDSRSSKRRSDSIYFEGRNNRVY